MFRILSAFSFLLLISISELAAQTDSIRRTEGTEVIVTGYPAEEGVTPVPMEVQRAMFQTISQSVAFGTADAPTPNS